MKRNNPNEYKKLVGVDKGTTKLISISWRYVLSKLGYKKGERLYGKWIIKNKTLILDIKRKEELNKQE